MLVCQIIFERTFKQQTKLSCGGGCGVTPHATSQLRFREQRWINRVAELQEIDVEMRAQVRAIPSERLDTVEAGLGRCLVQRFVNIPVRAADRGAENVVGELKRVDERDGIAAQRKKRFCTKA
jgi:hypothetical protein